MCIKHCENCSFGFICTDATAGETVKCFLTTNSWWLLSLSAVKKDWRLKTRRCHWIVTANIWLHHKQDIVCESNFFLLNYSFTSFMSESSVLARLTFIASCEISMPASTFPIHVDTSWLHRSSVCMFSYRATPSPYFAQSYVKKPHLHHQFVSSTLSILNTRQQRYANNVFFFFSF